MRRKSKVVFDSDYKHKIWTPHIKTTWLDVVFNKIQTKILWIKGKVTSWGQYKLPL